MDELERVIGNALEFGFIAERSEVDVIEAIANAVRTYLESSEVVKRVARAIANDLARQDGVEGEWEIHENGVIDFLDQSSPNLHEVARAALNAAGGKQDA